MKINHKKSGIMFFKTKSYKTYNIVHSNYLIVKTYKFLGIYIDHNLILEIHIKNLKKKTNYII